MKTPQILTGQQAIDQFGLNALIECRVAINTEFNGLGHIVMQIGVIADPDNCFIDLSDEPAVLYVEIGQDEDSSLYPIMADDQFVLLDDKNQPASNEVLARRIVELTNERDAALAQLVEVQNNCTGVSPCERFCEALATKKMFDNLQSDNRQLKVQVEQLLKPAKEAAEALGFASHHLRGRVSEKMLMDMAEKADALISAIGSTPAQCLSEHDAVVGRKAFIAGVNATGQGYNGELGLSDDEIIDLAELYVSRKIRQQAKGE